MTASPRCKCMVKVGALRESDTGVKKSVCSSNLYRGCWFNGRDDTLMPNTTDFLIYCSSFCDNWARALGASTAASQKQK